MSKKLLTKTPGPGAVVEFMQGNQAQPAWVLDETGGRLRVYTINKRESKLPLSRVLPWVGPSDESVCGRGDILERLTTHNARREKLAAEIDAMEIWELAQGEVAEESVAWFAGLLWEAPDADRLAALGRALLACKTHFKFHPPKFEVYAAEQVEKRLKEQAGALEREKVVTAGKAFFKELWTAWSKGEQRDFSALEAKLDPEAAEKLKTLLKTLVADPDDAEAGALWNTLKKGLPDYPHQPLLLAEQWGALPPHHNYLMDQAAYDAGDSWAQDFADEIEARRKHCGAAAPEPEPAPFVSVDSAATRDIDDAFFVEAAPEGGFRLQIALADPALGWEFGSPLDKKVARRASSVYLPEMVCHMLPEALGIGLYSLAAGASRPALILEWRLDGDGAPLSFAPRMGWVKVSANRTYADVEEELGREDCAATLKLGHALAEALRRRRLEGGAVVIERPDPEITLAGYPHDTRVDLALPPEHPKAQLLVSEYMLLANASVAEYAGERGVPLLFRTQDAVLPGDVRGIKDNPPDIHAAVRQLPPTLTETEPRPHATIGAKAYSPVTSPLRRYADFINLAQIRSHLEDGRPRFTREELDAAMPERNAASEATGRIQRFRPRYWKLLYLKQQCRSRMFEGVVVDDGGGMAVLSLPDIQIYVRAPANMFGEKIYTGQRFRLRLGKIDPLSNEIRVLEALEE